MIEQNRTVMASLFTINITFKNRDYPALVSIHQQGNDLFCMVRYIDKDLQYILVGDCIIFSNKGYLKQPQDLPGELAENLVHCTTTVISEYLSSKKSS